MNVEEIKRVIVSQREEMEEKFGKATIIEREVAMARLESFVAQPNVLAILGVRRCGKSVFSWQIFRKEKFGYVNFDDERLTGAGAGDLDKILQAFYELYGNIDCLILDEPQNVEGWELFANRLRRTKRVVITGSNSKLLAGELATHLTGRHIDFTLMPFSFREFLAYNGIVVVREDFYSTAKTAELKRQLERYLDIGGLPEAYVFGREIVARVYADIIEKDVLKRFAIRKKKTFKEFAKYLVSNAASEFTLRKLGHIFEIRDVHTVKNWADALEGAYLSFMLERYSPKLKQQTIAPKKIYCIDTGFVSAMGFRTSENRGRLMENLVATELLRRKNYLSGGTEVYYWKDHVQNEVDFVVKEGAGVRQLIQVTYSSSREEIGDRETASLIKASGQMKCGNLLVITWDYEGVLEADGHAVPCVPLYKWLLGVQQDGSKSQLGI